MNSKTRRNKVKRQTRLYLMILIALLTLFAIAAFGTNEGRNSSSSEKFLVLSGLLFVSALFLRTYFIYKFEKNKGEHNHDSFIDFFDSISNKNMRLDLVIFILPYIRKESSRKLEIIRKQINLSTFIVYFFTLICIFFISEIK